MDGLLKARILGSGLEKYVHVVAKIVSEKEDYREV